MDSRITAPISKITGTVIFNSSTHSSVNTPYIAGITFNIRAGVHAQFDVLTTVRNLGTGPLLQLGVLGFCLIQDWNVGVGVFPECQEVLIRDLRFGGVALHDISAGYTETG